MQLLKRLFDFYIFANLHVALAGFCITKITVVKFQIHNSLAPVFVGFSIILSYNFIRFYEFYTNNIKGLKKWFETNKKYLVSLTVLSAIVLWYLLFFATFNLKALYLLFPFAFMTIFYVIPLFKIGEKEVSFRNFPGIKIFSITVSWAVISVLFPLFEADFEFTLKVYIEFFQRFLILLAITIPFDIRDVNSDSNKLKTLPQILGITTVKKIGIALLVMFVLLTFFNENILITEVYVNIIIALITGFYVWFSSVEKSRYYTSFWVEAIPIFWLLLIVLFL
jgi:4-hydroxybenzoate polyprenyltransferase